MTPSPAGTRYCGDTFPVITDVGDRAAVLQARSQSTAGRQQRPRTAEVGYPYWSDLSIDSSSCSVSASRTGPVNHLRAESRYQPPNKINAPPTVSGA